jgi:hypothetical protein
MSMPPKAATVRLDEPFQVGRVRDVSSHGKRAEPFGFQVENIPPAGEHGDVRAFARERLGRREPHARGGAADDRGAPFQA